MKLEILNILKINLGRNGEIKILSLRFVWWGLRLHIQIYHNKKVYGLGFEGFKLFKYEL